jgi:small subunit ribosomal protein S6e
MAEFKIVVSDPKNAKSHSIEVKGYYASSLLGKKIGEEIDGILVGLPGYKLVLTGGSDKDGFPMRKDLNTSGRRRVLLSAGIGFHFKHKGLRKRRTIHGAIVSPNIVQLNFKIKEHGPKSIEEVLKKKK